MPTTTIRYNEEEIKKLLTNYMRQQGTVVEGRQIEFKVAQNGTISAECVITCPIAKEMPKLPDKEEKITDMREFALPGAVKLNPTIQPAPIVVETFKSTGRVEIKPVVEAEFFRNHHPTLKD